MALANQSPGNGNQAGQIAKRPEFVLNYIQINEEQIIFFLLNILF